jgi:hypothetical protein
LRALSCWETLLIIWGVTLAHLRRNQNPRRHWPWLAPLGALAIATAWLSPSLTALALVYAHPLVALVFLDREVCRNRPEWTGALRVCLACIPAMLVALWLRLAALPDLDVQDALTHNIVEHAGAELLPIPSRVLVATHAFLECVHYGVWVAAIPLISLGGLPWDVSKAPLARRSKAWHRAVFAVVAFGVVAMLGLWASFLANYSVTRDIYFTVAVLHVLAELPFLLRSL